MPLYWVWVDHTWEDETILGAFEMKIDHKFEVDEETLKAFETTEKLLKDMNPKDRLDYFEMSANILGDIQGQSTYIAKVLSRDDIMVSMTEKQYEFLFEGLREIALSLTDLNKAFAKKVPTLTEEVKRARHPKSSLVS